MIIYEREVRKREVKYACGVRVCYKKISFAFFFKGNRCVVLYTVVPMRIKKYTSGTRGT